MQHVLGWRRGNLQRPRGRIAVTKAAIPTSMVFLVCMALAGCGGADSAEGPAGGGPDAVSQGMPPAAVRLAPVVQEDLQKRWDAIGRLREIRRTVVAAEVPGRIVEMPVEEGDAVTGGQTTLARIDGVWARLDLAKADADVHSAEATLSQAQSDLKFLEDLEQVGSAKPKEVADQRAQVKGLSAQLEAAVATRDRVQEQVDRLAVLAPFDGVVVRKMTEIGQWVDPGAAVAEIVTTGSIDAVVDVPEDLVNAVKAGLVVELIVEPLALRTTGEVMSVTPLGAESARTYPVKIRLDDQHGRLKPGMSVTAQIPTSAMTPTLTVPRSAVFESATGTVVWAAVGEPGKQMALPQPVEILFGHGDRYAVALRPTSGPPLTPGMSVVVEGAERLFPTQPLLPVDAAPAAETPAPAGKANDAAVTEDGFETDSPAAS